MKMILIILGYLKWHYGKAIFSLTKIWRNLLDFIFNYFSINLLFKNFFDPWKRMADDYPSGFNLKKIFYTLLANLITRIVGMIMRFFLIIIGLFCYIIFILFYPLAIILWLLLPLLIIILILEGILLIIK